jgi:hypothetical protein
MPIVTTASDVVGIGTYVAVEAFALEGEEAPSAIVLPYGIYPDKHVEDIAEFEGPESAAEGFTFEWSLATPEGSEAELTLSGGVAIFLADVGGDYSLTLSATDEEGNTGETTWTAYAASYVGMGGIAAEPKKGQCAACHAGKVGSWAETGHAQLFVRGIDGEASSHYGSGCVSCHTTGFNNRPEAENAGFDDLAAVSEWLFPEVLEEGNWEAMKADYPDLASMALIQCESCHGPGSEHYTADVANMGPISTSLEYGNCAQCHAEMTHHVYPMEWELSAHSNKTGAFAYGHAVGNPGCATCHSGVGFMDTAAGKEDIRADYQVVSCAVCHDPHDATNPAQLRVYDTTIPLPDGTEISGAGASATCMTCHNSRQESTGQVEGEESLHLPHYSTAAELMLNTGGYTWGEVVDSSPHGSMVEDTCVTCHMAATPGMDDAGTPDDSSDDSPLPGHLTVGEHTFAMVSPVDGTENVAVCQECHTNIDSIEFAAKGDYDGDGDVEGYQAEIEGLRETLYNAMIEQGVVDLGHYPYFEFPEDASVDLRGAVWNYKFTGSGGSAVHNFKRTLGLLQLSIEKLGE